MQQSAALGCGRHEALMQQILTPRIGFLLMSGVTIFDCLKLSKTAYFQGKLSEKRKTISAIFIGFFGSVRRSSERGLEFCKR